MSSLAPGLVHGEGLPWASLVISGVDIRNMPALGHRALGTHLPLQQWGSGFGLDRLGPGSWLIILRLPHLFVCSEMSSEMCRLPVVCVLSRPCESDPAKGLIWSYFVSFQILIYSFPPCLPLI